MAGAVRVAAVDLGASSGRVMVGTVGRDRLTLQEVHRFGNQPVRAGGTWYWDILGIYREVLYGLRQAGPVHSIGVDSWAVDYGLLDGSGALLGNPVCYRDSRTDGVMDRVLKKVSAEEQFAITGLQQLPFNTGYQLASDLAALSAARTMLMIPDLIGYWLTGVIGAERTNASTTQLYDVRAGAWATDLAERLGIPRQILPALREPGDVIGTLRPDVVAEVGLPASTPVVAVGSHDTASAVVAAPFAPGVVSAYISSGTWSLVGVELDSPVLSEAARTANFTNEVGVDGTIRFLKNVMGLWVLTELLRAWARESDLESLLAEADDAPVLSSIVDVDGQAFLPPGDMESRIVDACRNTGQHVPRSPGAFVRCVLESLAVAYRRSVRLAGSLSGRTIEVVHAVGGGARNALLCQLTADACGVPVLAGPDEATALGNVLVQARALGADVPDLPAMRALVRQTHQPRRFEPTRGLDWDGAEARLPTSERQRDVR
jgi:rhamnulokinase